MTNFRVALGEVLREERLSQGMSMRQVSEKGIISLGFLSEVETGKKEIASEFMDDLITKGLGLEPHEIIMRTAIRMAGLDVPDTTESLFTRTSEWRSQYSDLVGA